MAEIVSSTSDTFCSPSADLLLRSSDDVDYYVHRVILTTSSSFFETMCSLPQPMEQNDAPDILPVVKMSENGRTLDILLQLVYPDKHPENISLSDLGGVLKAAEKYDMRGVIGQLRQFLELPRYLSEEPYRVFAIACQYNLGDRLIQMAARATLVRPPLIGTHPTSIPPELAVLSGLAYHSLLAYRKTCVNALSSGFKSTKGIWRTCPCRQNHIWAPWFEVHVDRTMQAFEQKVAVESIQSPALLNDTLTRISVACKYDCASSGSNDLLRLIPEIVKLTERRLSEIQFSFLKVKDM